jgi:hypothetical protein
MEAQDFTEYCAAMAPWAVFNTNRKTGAEFMSVTDFMMRHRARLSAMDAPAEGAGNLAPAPSRSNGSKGMMRIPSAGERPPSKFAPGMPDQVIDKFDAYAKRRRK